MNRLEINPNNEKYYSKEFMQGYKCGIRCQSYEDMKVLDKIRAEIKTEISDYEGYADFNEGITFGLRTALEIIDKHIKAIEG